MDKQIRMNIRNFLVGLTLPEILEVLRETAVAMDRDKWDVICEFICDHYED